MMGDMKIRSALMIGMLLMVVQVGCGRPEGDPEQPKLTPAQSSMLRSFRGPMWTKRESLHFAQELGKQAEAPLLIAIQSEDDLVCWRAAQVLRRLHGVSMQAAPNLRSILLSTDRSSVRRSVSVVLTKLGDVSGLNRDHEAVLMSMTHSEDAGERESGVHALGVLLPKPSDLALVRAAELGADPGEPWFVRAAAVGVLLRIAPLRVMEVHVDFLCAAMGSSEVVRATVAMEVLPSVPIAQRPRVVDACVALLSSGTADQKIVAARVLSAMGTAARPAESTLVVAANSSDAALQFFARRALRNLHLQGD